MAQSLEELLLDVLNEIEISVVRRNITLYLMIKDPLLARRFLGTIIFTEDVGVAPDKKRAILRQMGISRTTKSATHVDIPPLIAEDQTLFGRVEWTFSFDAMIGFFANTPETYPQLEKNLEELMGKFFRALWMLLRVPSQENVTLLAQALDSSFETFSERLGEFIQEEEKKYPKKTEH